MPKGSGLTKPLKLSKDLKDLLGVEEEEMSRPQVVKHLWAYLKENKLQDPENKQWFTPDKKMEAIFGKERQKAFGTGFPLSLGDLGDLGDQKYFYQWNSEKRK